jgi:hypothetical protein
MSTNFYFNNFPLQQVNSEQLLVEDLVIEAMQINGMDVYYISRSSRDVVDNLYGEDTLKEFRNAYPIEMYLENISGMDGEGDFISKFGLEIRDEITLLVSRRRFAMTVPLNRPREGDLIYVPLIQNFFEVTFVEHENDQAMFYTLGRGRGGNVYVYSLKLKQLAFSEEIIETGVDEIDGEAFNAYRRMRVAVANNVTGVFVPNEIVYQGTTLSNSSAQAIVYSFTANSHMEVIRVQGYFSNNSQLIGNTSNARAFVQFVDEFSPVSENIFEDIADNKLIEQEGLDIIDFTDKNPFGEP